MYIRMYSTYLRIYVCTYLRITESLVGVTVPYRPAFATLFGKFKSVYLIRHLSMYMYSTGQM